MNEFITKLANKDLRVVGIKQVLKSLDKGEIRCVILAEDVDSYFKECVLEEAKLKGVEVVTVPTKKELGQYCLVDRDTGCAGIK